MTWITHTTVQGWCTQNNELILKNRQVGTHRALLLAGDCYWWILQVLSCLLYLPKGYQTSANNFNLLTHWDRVTHICISKLTIIGPATSHYLTNAGLLLIGQLGTSEILLEILTFLFKKMRLKVLSTKQWPFCLGLNVLSNEQNGYCFPDNIFKCVLMKQEFLL